MLDESELNNYVERVSKLIENRSDLDKVNTKSKIINPLIEVLGWSIDSEDVIRNYQISLGSKIIKLDYAFQLNEKIQLLIKVQPLNKTINDVTVDKFIDYAKMSDTKWLVITNGKFLEIYNVNWGKNRGECLVNSLELNEFRSRSNELNLISKEGMVNQKGGNASNEIKRTPKDIKELKRSKENITNEITEIIQQKIPEEFHEQANILSKNFVNNLIKKIEEEIPTNEASTVMSMSESNDLTKLISLMPPRQRKNVRDLLRRVKNLGDINFILPTGKAWDHEYKWISLIVASPGGRKKKIGYIKPMNYGFFVQIQRPDRKKYEVGRKHNYKKIRDEILESVMKGYEYLT